MFITYKFFFSALIAQSFDRLLHPLDNVLSVQQKYSLSIIESFNFIKSRYGLKGFYRGFFQPFLTFGIARIIMLSTYYHLKYYLMKENFSYSCIIFCGIIAGIVDATLTAPAENYRIRSLFALRNEPKKISHNYRGYIALLLRSILGASIILAGTDLLILSRVFPSVINSYFLCALFTGIISQFFTSPFDVWKNLIMSDNTKTPYEHLSSMIAAKNFYSGIMTKMIRMGLGSGIVISIMNYLIS